MVIAVGLVNLIVDLPKKRMNGFRQNGIPFHVKRQTSKDNVPKVRSPDFCMRDVINRAFRTNTRRSRFTMRCHAVASAGIRLVGCGRGRDIDRRVHAAML